MTPKQWKNILMYNITPKGLCTGQYCSYLVYSISESHTCCFYYITELSCTSDSDIKPLWFTSSFDYSIFFFLTMKTRDQFLPGNMPSNPLRRKFASPHKKSCLHAWLTFNQENMRGQRGTLPVHALWYVIATKVIYRLALKRKYVFRDVRIKANRDLMWLVRK